MSHKGEEFSSEELAEGKTQDGRAILSYDSAAKIFKTTLKGAKKTKASLSEPALAVAN